MRQSGHDLAWLDGRPLDGVDAQRLAVLSPRQMGAADAAAIAAGTPGTVLMERAAAAIVTAAQGQFPAGDILVLAGPGNNGGDGWAAAARLADQGRSVALATDWPVASLPPDAAWAASQWRGDVLSLAQAGERRPTLVIDALFGAGLSRPLTPPWISLLQQLKEQGSAILAVDVPSGLDGATGDLLSDHPGAQLTVTFHAPKPGHLLTPGAGLCGSVRLADIGLGGTDAAAGEGAWLNGPAHWREAFPQPGLIDHKFSRGHLLVIGGDQMTGAARLSALAARRVGAGLVTVAAPDSAVPIYQADQPGLLIRSLKDLPELLSDKRITAAILGPGLAPDVAGALLDRFRDWNRPILLDGGALDETTGGAFSRGRDVGQTVLTPHEGEVKRLAAAPSLATDRSLAARDLAASLNGVVVWKGACTLVAEPPIPAGTAGGGRLFYNARASSYLATAGSGDVLAGLIGGLLAQGMPSTLAAAAGVWIHGEAGRRLGPGLIAEDLPNCVPSILGAMLG